MTVVAPVFVNHICTTPNACAYSGSDEECACIHDANICLNCGASIIAIDFDTGKPLTGGETIVP